MDRGSAKKESVFNIFIRIFAYFLYFTIFFYVEQIKNFVFQVEIKIAKTKIPKTMLTGYIASVLFGHTR